jgi:hypothetical protein
VNPNNFALKNESKLANCAFEYICWNYIILKAGIGLDLFLSAKLANPAFDSQCYL